MNTTLKTPALPIKFSNHNLSHTHTFSMEMGKIIPNSVIEMVPNDRFDISHDVFIRYAALKYPILSEVNCKIYDFAIPLRITNKYWKKFAAEDKLTECPEMPFIYLRDLFEISDSSHFPTGFQTPYFGGYCTPGSLADYLGFPTAQFFNGEADTDFGVTEFVMYKLTGYTRDEVLQSEEKIYIAPFVAYQMLWDRWFRDNNLEISWFSDDEDEAFDAYNYIVPIRYGQHVEQTPRCNLREAFVNAKGYVGLKGLNGAAYIQRMAELRCLLTLHKKSWEKDYFTSALPSPQYGDAVPVPVNGLVQYDDNQGNTAAMFVDRNGDPFDFTAAGYTLEDLHSSTDGTLYFYNSGEQVFVSINNASNLKVKDATFTINDLRAASAVQRYQEVLMRVGHRYSEQIKALFSQIVPNSELEEPLFIGARTIPVQINSISQTSATTSDSVLGDYAGQAHVVGNSDTVKWHATDFCFYMSVVSVLPRTVYMNGLPRYFSRQDRLDYFNPLFQKIGDQSVFNRELFLSPDKSKNALTFGYSPRFSDYKECPSRVSGDFANSLQFMTLARNFAKLPPLNKNFINVDKDTVNRAFATDGLAVDHLYCITKNKVYARRPMEYNPMPQLL